MEGSCPAPQISSGSKILQREKLPFSLLEALVMARFE
jgi:hypothetical protein